MAKEKKKETIRIINVRHPANKTADLKTLVGKSLGLSGDAIENVSILRRSTDARQERIDFVYTLSASVEVGKAVLDKILQRKDVEVYSEKEIKKPFKTTDLKTRPVIVGCGPAGLFTAITLVERGARPIVIERGQRIKQRVKTVESFWNDGKLDPESNTLFGEGGAGTFSDGKLTTRIKSRLKEKVFKEFVKAGADDEIVYLSKPHLGTDRLREIIPHIVEDLQQRGVEFLFNTPVSDIKIEREHVKGIVAGRDFIKTEHIFLATGHSARDIYRLLNKKGVRLEPKGFAVGLRIEHPQEFIDKTQLGTRAGTKQIGPAEYFLSYKDKDSGRGVYTFCMCPGGYVIGCSSSYGQLCTNGMSTYRRNSPWANAAVVVTVRPDDFSGASVLKGIEFQGQLEKNAFIMGGKNYFAPVQHATDFVKGKKEQLTGKGFACSYRPGTIHSDLRNLLPEFITEPLRRGLRQFEQKMPGFIDEGLLIGIETKTSSPVRIVRNLKNFNVPGVKGLIPVGEGSGYAGGIVSSAVDGIQAAMQFDS